MIEQAYTLGAALGLEVWCQDEAGPFQTAPYPGQHWQPSGEAHRQPHEYQRNGTAKLLTLLRPQDGTVRVKGVRSCTNTVLHGWLQTELGAIVDALPVHPVDSSRAAWTRWQDGLSIRWTLRETLPPLRVLLIFDNLVGHTSPALRCWCMDHGIMVLYTPLSGSWLNMAESIQRILKRRALDGCHPQGPDEAIAWLEAVAAAWNRQPTPFVWGGKRATRRQRARQRRHEAGGSGATTLHPVRRSRSRLDDWRRAGQVTH